MSAVLEPGGPERSAPQREDAVQNLCRWGRDQRGCCRGRSRGNRRKYCEVAQLLGASGRRGLAPGDRNVDGCQPAVLIRDDAVDVVEEGFLELSRNRATPARTDLDLVDG